MKRYISKDEGGYALLIVLMMIVVFAIIGTMMLSMTNNSLAGSVREKSSQSTYYLAENGVTLHMLEVERAVSNAQSEIASDISEGRLDTEGLDIESELERRFEEKMALFNDKIYEFEDQNGSTATAVVSMEKVGVDDAGHARYRVASKGMVGGEEGPSRNVSGYFSLQQELEESVVPPRGPFAQSQVYVKQGFDMQKDVDVDLYVLGDTNVTLKLGSRGHLGEGRLYVPRNQVNRVKSLVPNQPVTAIDAVPDLTMPTFPTFPSNLPKVAVGTYLKMTEDMEGGTVVLRNKGTLTVEITDDRILVVDSITAGGSGGHLTVVGPPGKKLHLYVKDRLSNITLNEAGKNNLAVYIRRANENIGRPGPSFPTGKSISVTGYADIFAEDGLLDLNGNSELNGHFLTNRSGSYSYSGGMGYSSSGKVLWGPYLDLTFKGSITMKGGVFVNSIKMQGAASLLRSDDAASGGPVIDDIPFVGGSTTRMPRGTIVPELVIEE